MEHRAAAHGTRLQRDVKLAVVQPVVAQSEGRRTQRHDFGMCRRIMAVDRCVAPYTNHMPVAHNNRSHWNLARGRGQTGLLERQPHERFVSG